jgi:hypothetical protein
MFFQFTCGHLHVQCVSFFPISIDLFPIRKQGRPLMAGVVHPVHNAEQKYDTPPTQRLFQRGNNDDDTNDALHL